MTTSISSNTELIKSLYAAFRAKDYEQFRQICTPDIEWIQNPGFPGGGHHHGAEAIIQNVFQAFNNEWETFGYEIEEYLDAGTAVIVLGRYVGKHRQTGKPLEAAAAHVYDVRDGKVARFRQYTDTAMILQAMQS